MASAGESSADESATEEKPQPGIRRLWFTLALGLLALFVTPFLLQQDPAPLTPIESQLVGEWSVGHDNPTRSFLDNRTFSTSEGQFSGVWKIDNDRLTVTYWSPIERPHDYSIHGAVQWIRRSQKTYSCAWDIEFAEGGEKLTLIPVVAPPRPAEEWIWTRIPAN